MARMDKKYMEVLDGHLELLVNTLPTILEMVLVKMNTHFLDHQKETIRTQTSSVRKVVEFVNALKTMQNEALYKFLNVLDEMHYQHVANEIRRAADIEIPDTRPVFTSPQGTASLTSINTIPAPTTATAVAAAGDVNILIQKPTMALARGICDYIAARWMDIGYCLDFDEDGNQVDLIEEDGNGNPRKCCMLLLKTWIQSEKGKQPASWKILLDILLSLDLKTAHDKVLGHLQNEQKKKTQDSVDSIPVNQAVEATSDSLQSHSSTTSSTSTLSNTEPLSHECIDHQPACPSQD